MKWRLFATAVLVLSVLCGCQEQSQQSLWDQIKQLGQEKVTLKQQNESLQSENEDLREQIETLSAISPEVRLGVLGGLKDIKIGRRSGLFDKDKDGVKEKLIVYVSTIDQAGDVTKIPGSARVQLWNLNKDSEEALLGQWEIEPEELKTLWAGTFMTNYYRLTFEIADLLIDSREELTVKVKFTDYVTGKTLGAQKVIQP